MAQERLRQLREISQGQVEPSSLSPRTRVGLGLEPGSSEGETLTSRDLPSAELLLETVQRLSFHERMQLYRLNAPLKEAGLACRFTLEDVARADPQVCDVLWETLKIYPFEGSGLAMAVILSTKGLGGDGKLNLGRFNPMFMTEEAYRERGGKFVVLVDKETEVPEGETQGRLQIPAELLSKLNERLTSLNRIPIDERLGVKTPVSGVETVTGYSLFPEETPENGWFYKRGQIDLLLQLDSGRSLAMTFNALGDNKKQGSVNLVHFTDGRFGVVNTVRMLAGAGFENRIEISRGYADVAVKKLTEALQKRFQIEGIEANQLGMELGLLAEKAIRVETRSIRCDFAFENVTVDFSRLLYDSETILAAAPGYVQHIMDEFEGLAAIKVSGEEILGFIEDGSVVDAFSLSCLASEFLRSGEVVLNERYADTYLVLERRSIPQLGGEESLVVPQGPAFKRKGLVNVGNIHPNTGAARFWYKVKYSTDPGVLPVGPKYEKVEISKVLGMLKDLQFSTADAATLFRSLLGQRVLIPKRS